jgi:hypothetical protein
MALARSDDFTTKLAVVVVPGWDDEDIIRIKDKTGFVRRARNIVKYCKRRFEEKV